MSRIIYYSDSSDSSSDNSYNQSTKDTKDTNDTNDTNDTSDESSTFVDISLNTPSFASYSDTPILINPTFVPPLIRTVSGPIDKMIFATTDEQNNQKTKNNCPTVTNICYYLLLYTVWVGLNYYVFSKYYSHLNY